MRDGVNDVARRPFADKYLTTVDRLGIAHGAVDRAASFLIASQIPLGPQPPVMAFWGCRRGASEEDIGVVDWESSGV